MLPVQAYENFTFAKQEFLNQISIVSAFRIASHFGEISYTSVFKVNNEGFHCIAFFYFKSLTTFSAKVLLTILSKAGLVGIKSAL